jgi:hypothetical protein
MILLAFPNRLLFHPLARINDHDTDHIGQGQFLNPGILREDWRYT